MEKDSQQDILLEIFVTLIAAMAIIYLGAIAWKKREEYNDLSQEKKDYPDDLINQRLSALLNRIQVDQSLKSMKNLESATAKIFEDNAATKQLCTNNKIINPLYMAYLRVISKRIFSNNRAFSQAAKIVYAASNVDIITPMLLASESSARNVTVFMLDINAQIKNELKNLQTIFMDNTLDDKVPAKLIDRMFKQFYLLSEFDSSQTNQKLSSVIMLAFFLQQMKVQAIVVKDNSLSFNLQGKIFTFHFMTADVTKPDDLQELRSPLDNSDYIYLTKAAVNLSHKSYLPTVFNTLGRPSFCLVNTRRINPNFQNQLMFWQSNGICPPREKVLQSQFISDTPYPFLKEVRNPTLRRLHDAIIEASKTNTAQEITDYHLPTLHV